MSKTIELTTIRKAQPIADEEIPSLVIRITETFTFESSLSEQDTKHSIDARKLGRALEKVLPGGTFDHLALFMLSRKLSHLIVPWSAIREGADDG